jgi:hypothetical protein
MVPTLRAQVIEVLRQAGFSNREDSLPTYVSGGTFSAAGGGPGVSVTCQRWDSSPAELAELRAAIAAALRAAGLKVREESNRLYVLAP